MVLARVKLIAITFAMPVNIVTTNAVKTAQIHRWSYEEIARIDPAQRNADYPLTYFSVGNESSQRLFSLLTLCIMFSQ
jgi:uncharacterized protein (DUF885 family)